MICPKCGQDTPLQKTFCVNCGGLLEVGTGDVREAVEGEVRSEAQAALVRRAGTWLAVSLVVLAGAIAFRSGNTEKDLPRFDEPPVLQVLSVELQRSFPTVDLPLLPPEVHAP